MAGVGSKADEKDGVASDDKGKTVVAHVADGIHGVGCELKDAIKDEVSALEEDVTPVPAIILDDVVGLLLDPKVEEDEEDTGDPTRGGLAK